MLLESILSDSNNWARVILLYFNALDITMTTEYLQSNSYWPFKRSLNYPNN